MGLPESYTDECGSNIARVYTIYKYTRYTSTYTKNSNYSDSWAVGADSVCTSNIKDHAQTDQHTYALMLLKKEHVQSSGLGLSSYAPIAKALTVLPEDAKETLGDIAHFVATEKHAFSKYSNICELEAQHGVNIGSSYTNEVAGKTFCHYIAKSRREDLLKCLYKAKYFLLLMDGSTDAGNIDEIFLILWCDVVWPKEWSWQSKMPSHICHWTSLMRCSTDCITCKRNHLKSEELLEL